MENIELRVHDGDFSVLSNGDLLVRGYVNESESFSEVLFDKKKKVKFREKITRGAFNDAISRGFDIDFLAEHDQKLILASTRNGSLSLTEDDRGLYMEARIAKTSYGRDYYELIKEGILRNMSFGFSNIKDAWKRAADGIYERTIEKLDLFEVSVVKNPAYAQSAIAARGIDLVEEVIIPEGTEDLVEPETEYEKILAAVLMLTDEVATLKEMIGQSDQFRSEDTTPADNAETALENPPADLSTIVDKAAVTDEPPKANENLDQEPVKQDEDPVEPEKDLDVEPEVKEPELKDQEPEDQEPEKDEQTLLAERSLAEFKKLEILKIDTQEEN